MTLLLALAALLAPAQVEPQLVYSDSLAPGVEHPLGKERFWRSERSEWRLAKSVKDDGLGNPVPDSGPCLTFKSTQQYKPRVRSPHSLALLRGVPLAGSQAFEVEAMQTGIETPHRDLVLVFGFESPEQFFYAHLGMVPDATSSNIFEVNETPRRRVGEIGAKRIEWGRGVWHRLRVECDEKGRVRVFVDDLTTPHFEEDLGRPVQGLIGFGSFDDAGAFRNLKVWGSAAAAAPQPTWKSNPFGGAADAVIVNRTDAAPHTKLLQLKAGRTPLWAVLVDTNQDGTFQAGIDRWRIADRPSSPPIAPQLMLALDEPAVTPDRIAVQPWLGPDGRFVQPYRFRSIIPSQSYPEFLRARDARRR